MMLSDSGNSHKALMHLINHFVCLFKQLWEVWDAMLQTPIFATSKVALSTEANMGSPKKL